MINSIISNIYFSNLARSISETKRKKQIDTTRKDELNNSRPASYLLIAFTTINLIIFNIFHFEYPLSIV